VLAELERHPHARAVLGPALEDPLRPSHAYLFHGPGGAGKRAAARALAAQLLADGAADPDNARLRVMHGTHPDLTWVVPSGAHEMLVSDIDEPVIAAAAKTPFESRRRVFVIERADEMGEEAANRMLKTLEEPPAYVHLILISAHAADVLPTIASRCQLVRFEAASADDLAQRLREQGVAPDAADACARLGLGDAERAGALALGEGPALRAAAERFATAAIRDQLADRPWTKILELAEQAGATAEAALAAAHAEQLDQLSRAERTTAEREHSERAKRVKRRSATATIDLALATAGLYYRDAAVLAHGAPELIHATDRRAELAALAEASTPRMERAVALVEDSREALALNVNEELALETLAYRIAALR
jgi:DNA polymerase-3 subunit delta'